MIKTMLKIITLLATLALLLTLALPASAVPNTTVVFTIGSTTYTVNGQAQTMDVAPYIDSNGRTVVPVRYLAEAIGVSDSNIGWNSLLRLVTLAMNGTTIRMVIGVPVITVGLDPQTMDTSPQIIPPGRTMLPARFVAQAFGYTVTWNASAQTVTITNVSNQPVGQIGTSPFQPTISNLTVTVGSTTASVNSGASTISLPVAPVLVVPTDQGKQWYLDHSANNTSDAYTDQDIIVNSAIKTDIYVPVASILQAFGVPSANVRWDGSRLTIYLSPSKPIYLTSGSAVDTSENGSTGNLQDPLLMIGGVPMLDSQDMRGFMFGIDMAKDHLLNGIQDNADSGANMYNGTVDFTYHVVPSAP